MARYSTIIITRRGEIAKWTYEFTQFILPSTSNENNKFLINLIVSWVTSGIYT